MKTIFLFVVLNLCAISSWALVPMEQHIMSASQGMSAFYMHMLSDGDRRYLKQFNRYQRSADASLAKMKKSEKGEIFDIWSALKNDLKFRYTQGEAVYFSGAVRIAYRDYLTSLYLQFKDNPNTKKRSVISAINRIKILSTLLAARALDLVSSDYGATDMSTHHMKFNSIEVAEVIEEDIQFLIVSKASAIEPSILRKIDSKFHFIKNNLIDTKTQTAYFLIYRNMLSMSKILNKY